MARERRTAERPISSAGAILGEIFATVDCAPQRLHVPAAWIVYRHRLRAGVVIEIALPPDLTRRDVDRIYAALLTQADDFEPEAA